MNISLENMGTINKNRITIGPLRIWFSYETPVAFDLDRSGIVVRENDWGPTSGKLINQLESDKKKHVKGEQFEKMLDEITARLSLK